MSNQTRLPSSVINNAYKHMHCMFGTVKSPCKYHSQDLKRSKWNLIAHAASYVSYNIIFLLHLLCTHHSGHSELLVGLSHLSEQCH